MEENTVLSFSVVFFLVVNQVLERQKTPRKSSSIWLLWPRPTKARKKQAL